jgi:hypothetical protein
MRKLPMYLFFLALFSVGSAMAQAADSTIDNLQQIPVKYLTGIDKKVNKYTSRVTSKTERTLTKLSRWENKIHALLQKANPAAAEKLFGNNQLTFSGMLQKLKEGEAITTQYHAQYDGYRDKLTTDINYLQSQKENVNASLLQPLEKTGKKLKQLNEADDASDMLQQVIKERKKQLISESIQYIGKSKYLTKINKESFYYAETLKNYKEVFNDPAKTEMLAKNILSKIPSVQHFFKKNSLLSSLFAMPEDNGGMSSLAGLQTRASVQSLIQDRLGSGGPSAMQQFQQNLQSAQSELTNLKNKFLGPMQGNGGGDLPDFKPNMERTKTLKQRLEFGSNLQFGKSNAQMPSTTDIGMSVGYRINDKSVAGIGASYKLGMGSIDRIRLSNQGVSLRSFMDWKLKRQFFISGGMEMNYLANVPAAAQTNLPITSSSNQEWQPSALAGISKKLSIKTKWFKQTNIQLLYDFLSHQHLPVSQPVVFRMGYMF